jgi:glycosyltransferase involved in cell wall biosynthesis
MNILFWTDGFWPRIGGMETQGFLFVKAMQERGHSCLVLAQKDDPFWKDEEVHQGISIKRFDFQNIILNRGPNNLGVIRKYLEWVLQVFRPDVIHVNGCIGWSVMMFSMLQNMFSMPLILTVHAPFYHKNEMLSFVRKICREVDRICCVSKWVVREMEKRLPEVRDKVRLIYNGLPPFEIAPTPLSFSPPILLLMGRLSVEKGFATAIQAFSLMKKRGSSARLLIAGVGAERPELEQLVGELGWADSVEFTGAVERDEIPHLMNRASLVIVPSYFETFGLVALEAMQMGRPVIATNVGGLPEIISEDVNGCLVPPEDPEALCKAIRELLSQPEKAFQMGREARKYALKNFTMHQNVTQYEEVYRGAIS